MDFSQILKDYKFKTELHAHSFPVSPCGKFSPEEVVELYKEAGVDSIVLTNHLTPLCEGNSPKEIAEKYLSDYRRAKEAARGEINVILGVEIRFEENSNDYLVYGIDEADVEYFASLLPYGIEKFYKEAKNDKNVIIQAHPFRKTVTLGPAEYMDGIESMNMHPGHNSKISVAMQYAKEMNMLVTGGTDFHHPNHQALCLMRTQKEMKDSFDVAQAIKSKATVFDCSGHIIIPYLY